MYLPSGLDFYATPASTKRLAKKIVTEAARESNEDIGRNHKGEWIRIVAGDVNETDTKEDRQRNQKIGSQQGGIGETLTICAGFKDAHRHNRQMTHEQNTANGETKSRIDRIYVRNRNSTRQVDSEVLIPRPLTLTTS